jgi:hypothetical protein
VGHSRTLRLFLGIRLRAPSADHLCRQGEQALEALERLETDAPIPVHWNFAVARLLGTRTRPIDNLIERIKSRLSDRGDRILPAGFYGSVHSHLLRKELERELRWCYKNPWFPALKSVFGTEPESILPWHPDPLREAASGVYSRQGFRLLGVPLPASPLLEHSPAGKAGRLRLLAAEAAVTGGSDRRALIQPVLVVSTAREGELHELVSILLSPAFHGRRLFVLVDPGVQPRDSADAGGITAALVTQLARHEAVEFLSLDPAALEPGNPEISLGELLAGADITEYPRRRIAWARAEGSRSGKRQTNDRIRAVLEQMAAGAQSPEAPGGGDRDDRIQITNVSMSGSVTLMGAEVQATFVEGRLADLQQNRQGFLTGTPACSFIAGEARRIYLQTQSAFSFERDGENGLRANLTAELPYSREPMRAVIDYFFRADERELSVELAMHYPGFRDLIVDENAPLEIPLFFFGGVDGVTLEAEFPDGSRYGEQLQPREAIKVLYGQRFLAVKNGSAVHLLAGAAGRPLIRSLELQVLKFRGRCLLLANLGGSYRPQPASHLSGVQERLSYRIGSLQL